MQKEEIISKYTNEVNDIFNNVIDLLHYKGKSVSSTHDEKYIYFLISIWESNEAIPLTTDSFSIKLRRDYNEKSYFEYSVNFTDTWQNLPLIDEIKECMVQKHREYIDPNDITLSDKEIRCSDIISAIGNSFVRDDVKFIKDNDNYIGTGQIVVNNDNLGEITMTFAPKECSESENNENIEYTFTHDYDSFMNNVKFKLDLKDYDVIFDQPREEYGVKVVPADENGNIIHIPSAKLINDLTFDITSGRLWNVLYTFPTYEHIAKHIVNA